MNHTLIGVYNMKRKQYWAPHKHTHTNGIIKCKIAERNKRPIRMIMMVTMIMCDYSFSFGIMDAIRFRFIF